MNKLEVQHVRKKFRNRVVVEDVSLSVAEGEIVGLLGPNGAGKTTTFYTVLGLHRPDRGRVLLNGEDISQWPVYLRARRGIVFLPQEPSIFRSLSVQENLQAVAQMIPGRRGVAIDSLLRELGLDGLRHRKGYLLSGGERRRLEIARSLMLEPKFLLLDEPFAGIDPIQIGELKEMILQLKGKGIGVMITDHNVREILKITNRSYIIHRGNVIFTGDSHELLADARVKREYLGEEFRWN